MWEKIAAQFQANLRAPPNPNPQPPSPSSVGPVRPPQQVSAAPSKIKMAKQKPKLFSIGNPLYVEEHPSGIPCPFDLALWSKSKRKNFFDRESSLSTQLFGGFPTRAISGPKPYTISINRRRAGQGGRGRGQAGRGQAAGQGPAGAGAGREGGHGRAGQGQDEGREGGQQAGTGRQHRDIGASIGFKFFHHAILNRPACTQVKSGKAIGG